jgi:hypothetical protein
MQDNRYPEFDHVSLEDLGRLVNVVSLESAASTQFFMDTKARFTQFFGKADSFFKHLKFEVLGVGKVDASPMMRSINKVGFVDSSEKPVIVPQGFIGLWVPYAADLYDGMKASGRLTQITSDFNTCLGKLVSDPELLKSVNGIPYTGAYDVGLYGKMEVLNKKYFDVNNESISRPLSGVLERVADIPLVQNTINDCASFDRSNPAANIIKAIGRSMEMSRRLMPMLEDGDGTVSKPVREQLIALTYSIAKEVEAYSILLYRLRQFKLSVEESVRAIDKA